MALTLTAALRSEFAQLFQTCVIIPKREAIVEQIVAALVANRGRYAAVAEAIGIPWHVVAVIHNMESTRNFTRHLHNGDPLTARTKQEPPGRPKSGMPPFTWEVSATDALVGHRLDKWADWTVAGTLFQLETYNGTGYRRFHPEVKSPYLWSFCNHYARGKYVADGTWSDTAVSDQCGAAVLLRRMVEKQLIEFTDQPLPTPGAMPLGVVYAAAKPVDAAVIARASTLQNWLNSFPGIFVRPDGWAGQATSDAYKAVTGHFLPGDPRA